MKELTMRAVISWLMHNVVLLLPEEWGKAQQREKAMQAAYRIEALCEAELHVFRAQLTNLERMQMEATQTAARVPTARGLIYDILQERMQRLARTGREETTEKRVTVLKSVK
jgi:hypothetical protein